MGLKVTLPNIRIGLVKDVFPSSQYLNFSLSKALRCFSHSFNHRPCYLVYVALICIPVYIKGQKALSLFWLSDLTEVGSPMINRVNNDVTLGLTTGHWSTPL